MDVEKLPIFERFDYGTVEDPARPILSLDWLVDAPHRVPNHAHSRAQIMFLCSGVYWVTTDTGSFVIPAGQAIWIPSHIHHETFTNDRAHALFMFVDESYAQTLAHDCMVVDVNPLLVQLFLRAVAYGNDYMPSGKEVHLVQVILDELSALTPSSLQLPLGQDKRLRKVMDLLLASPSDERGIDELAQYSGASARTLSRLFKAETGMNFIEWRHKLRLLQAIDRLSQGQSVTQVALDLGYQSVSAFIAMFRRRVGVTPSHFASGAGL